MGLVVHKFLTKFWKCDIINIFIPHNSTVEFSNLFSQGTSALNVIDDNLKNSLRFHNFKCNSKWMFFVFVFFCLYRDDFNISVSVIVKEPWTHRFVKFNVSWNSHENGSDSTHIPWTLLERSTVCPLLYAWSHRHSLLASIFQINKQGVNTIQIARSGCITEQLFQALVVNLGDKKKLAKTI